MRNKTKQVMIRAWALAKRGQKQFGGKVSEYLSEAMKIAWAIVKNMKEDAQEKVEATLNKFKQVFFEMYNQNGLNPNMNVWCKYGKNRLYINDCYIEFNGFYEVVNVQNKTRNDREQVVFNNILNKLGVVA